MAPNFSSQWMQTHRHVFGDRPLTEICLPSSHDSGTYRKSFGTIFGTEGNVLTQTKSILGQLELGVRRFELRPSLANPSGETTTYWNCGHYSYIEKLGVQGANCAPITEVVNDINNFTEKNAELIIIDIDHVSRKTLDNPFASTEHLLTSSEWQDLLGLLAGINNRFSLKRAGGRKDKQLQQYTLNEFIGKKQAAVVLLIDGYSNVDEIFQKGMWPKLMQNGEGYLNLAGTGVGRSQGSLDAVFSTLNPLHMLGIGPNSSSALSIAREEQSKNFPLFLQEMAAQNYPSSFNLDRIENADHLTFCLAMGYEKFNVATGLANQNKVIVYGGYLIIEPAVHHAIQNAIDNGKSFRITNENLHGDPWPGWPHQGPLGEGRRASQLEQDVISITYGPSQIRRQDLYVKMLKAIANRDRFLVTNDSMGGDPQPGARKPCVIRFRDMNASDIREVKVDEYQSLDFETFWEKFAKSASGVIGHV